MQVTQQTSVPVRLQIRWTDAVAIQKIYLVVINCAGTVVDMFNTTTESMELTYTSSGSTGTASHNHYFAVIGASLSKPHIDCDNGYMRAE